MNSYEERNGRAGEITLVIIGIREKKNGEARMQVRDDTHTKHVDVRV